MKKLTILVILFAAFASLTFAQTTLDPDQFVNDQITGPGVYMVENGKSYAFDGRLDISWDVTIEGPSVDWIANAENPPVLVNTPAEDGSARQFVEIDAGGSLTLKNLILSGLHSNGAIVGTAIDNVAGSGYTADNCVFSDWQDWIFLNNNKDCDISVTNCIFINGVRLSYSPWGGFPMRMNVAGNNVTLENNTVVNSGRLYTNSGPFFNTTMHELHNTYLNTTKAGHEQRAYEMIQANNIFYNYDFCGHKITDNVYDSYFTTWNYFADAKTKLDSISLYLGQNLFYRSPEIVDWFAAQDSMEAGLLWEHADVDSFITIDDNYKIGTNYSGFDPEFTTGPGNLTAQLQFLDEYWYPDHRGTDWPDWRVASPVTWDSTSGLPMLNGWPVSFDLSYANTYLQTAGTDGLPLGDLNWFPEKKAQFLANKDAFVAALVDSISNATALFDPTTMDATPMITPNMVAVKHESSEVPASYYLDNNYPNPFNPSTTIRFGIPEQSKVTLSVFNILGQKVFEMTEKSLSAGTHSYNFNASSLSSGIYVYSVHAVGKNGKNFTASKKMMLLK